MKRKIQFAFYTKGYGKDGTVKALVIDGRKKIVVDRVICRVPCFTTTRRKNPVFVVECYGILRIVSLDVKIAYIES